MKKILLIIFLQVTIFSFAQNEDAWVYFTDKPDAVFYMENPLEMLSQRALDRRVAQGIALDEKDIPVSVAYINQVTAASGIIVMAKSKWLNALHIRGSIEDIESLEGFTFVDSVQFADKSINSNMEGKVKAQAGIKKLHKNQETQVTFGYGNSNNQIEMLNGHLLHQQDYTGTGKIIAVMDSGFQGVNTGTPFQRLFDNDLILGGYDFVNGNANFYAGGSHGTLVLSTMGGYVEDQLVGTAPDAQYYLFITEDIAGENPVEESYWVEAAEKADSLGVDVINTSLGYFDYDNSNYSYTYEDMNGTTSFISRGADIAFSRGMICVVSAGNSGNSEDPHIAVPADAVNVLSVGAVNASEEYASFSSIGPSFDGRVKPDVMAQGQAAIVSDVLGNIGTSSGTSFSCPIIAGMVASLWQALPDKTNVEIMQIVKESASLYGTPNVQFGYGIPDFNLALMNALGLSDYNSDRFILYPNPIKNDLNFSFPEGTVSGQVVLYNNLGQEVLNKEITKTNPIVSLEYLSSGIYFYNVTSGRISQNGKLIKK